MTKYGWWSINFSITLEGESVGFDNLDECSQEHILAMISEGYRSGEIVEENDEVEDEQ